MTARLWNRQTGQVEELSPEAATEAIASGTHGAMKGITIPAVDQDGNFWNIDPTDAEKAFYEEGYRYASMDEIAAHQNRTFAKERKKIDEEHFGGVGGQLMTGAQSALSQAAFGLPDLMLSEQAKEAVRTAKEVNPMSDIAGQVVGTVANVAGPLTGTAYGAGALAAKAGKAAESALLAKTAQGIVSRTAAKGLGSAVEGATLGMGQGISEAALGEPDQIVENILSGVGMGAMFGGILGAGGQGLMESAPLVKALGRGVSDVTAPVRKWVADNAVYPVLSSKAERAALEAGMDPDHAARIAFMHGGEKHLYDTVKQGTAEFAELERKYAENAKDLNRALSALPGSEKRIISEKMAEVSGDVLRGQRELMDTARGYLDEIDGLIDNYIEVPANGTTLYLKVKQAVKDLNKLKTRDAQSLARDIDDRFSAYIRPPTVVDEATGKRVPVKLGPEDVLETTVYNEVQGARSVRTFVNDLVKNENNKPDKYAGKVMLKLANELQDYIRNHSDEAIRKSVTKADDYYSAADQLGKFLKQKAKGPIKEYSKALFHPQAGEYLDVVIQKAPEFAPMFKQFAEAVGNVRKEREVVREIMNTVKEFKAGALATRQSPEALREVLTAIGAGKDIMGKLDALAGMRDQVARLADMSAADKLIHFRRAAGQPVEKELEELSKNWAAYNKLDGVKQRHAGDRSEGVGGFGVGKTAVAAGAGWLGAEAFGFDPKTGAMIAGAGFGLHRLRQDAWQGVKTLTAIQTVANTGAKSIAKATESVVKNMTSGKLRAIGISQATRLSIEERREEFKKHAETLTQLSDPQIMADTITDRFAYMQGAPGVKQALGAHMAKTAMFLNEKMPKDPTQGVNIFVKDSQWKPSDAELSTFYRYVRAAENPATVLDSLSSGRVTKEEVETIQTLYPLLYDQMRSGIVEALVSSGKKVSYPHRIALGTMFDMQTDASLDPDFMMRLQQNYVVQDKGGRPKGKTAPNVAGQAETDLQSTLNRREN